MRRLPLLLLALLLAGCPLFGIDDDDDSAALDDDDAVDDDDAATGACSEAGAPGVEDTVPCDFAVGGDVWTLQVAPGDELTIAVDTVDPQSTFDPRFRLVDEGGAFLVAGDDDCDCAFPPPGDYRCAEATWIADADLVVELHVASFIADACVDGGDGAYVLRLSVDGAPVDPLLEVDDGPTLFGG